MTDDAKFDYIFHTLEECKKLLPKSENVILDKDDISLHQLKATTVIALDYLNELQIKFQQH
jgi:hypothetical protein